MTKLIITFAFSGLLALGLSGCGESSNSSGTNSADGSISGSVNIDGSSTVFPITSAVAEEFQGMHRDVRMSVSYSGTGGGFKKFDLGEKDINNASRPIKQSEIDTILENGYSFIELPIAYDGLTVILNPENDWVDYFTVEELNKIWEPNSTVTKWSDVRPEWPDREISLYGAGTASGTFDYFTEAINGESGASRSDYAATEDDNLTVQGVSGDIDAMGYLGLAYFEENSSVLRATPIKASADAEAIEPSIETVMNGTYVPLSRPLFIYVNREFADSKPQLDEFVKYYLSGGGEIIKEIGYIPLPETAYKLVLERYENRITGSIFEKIDNPVGMTVEEMMAIEEASHSEAESAAE